MEINSANSKVNVFVLLTNAILDFFLIIGYLIEYFKGTKSIGYICIMMAIVLIPMVSATIFYLKNHQSSIMKFITLFGYFLLYIFVMFTANADRPLVFVYMFPIILGYFLYFDMRIIVISSVAFLLINIAKIIYYIVFLRLTDSFNTTNYLIQFAAVFIFSFSLVFSTKLSNEFSIIKIASIENEQKKQDLILEDVLHTAAILDKNSKEVYRIVGELSELTDVAANAVQEIEKGASDTAANIQVQSELTHNIHNLIKNASRDSESMEQTSLNTSKAVEEGMSIIETLSLKAAGVIKNSDSAYKSMQELKEKADEIRSITELISNISEQTNMLSLNAAIESARAGEAGKGFAVVAEEIRALAAQSKESTNKIAWIVNALNEQSEKSAVEVQKLKQSNEEQDKLVSRTREIFLDISNKTNDVRETVNKVNDLVNKILHDNDRLVESINDISAVSEEVTASAQEASALTAQNFEKADEAKGYVNELIDTSVKLEKYMS